MWKLRLGEVWKSQSQQVQGCQGGASEPLLSEPTSPSAQRRAGSPPCLPTPPTHRPTALGSWGQEEALRGIEGRMADPEAAGEASATWTPGPQADLVRGAGHRPDLSRSHLQTKVRVWCLQRQGQERGCFSFRSRHSLSLLPGMPLSSLPGEFRALLMPAVFLPTDSELNPGRRS